MLRFLVAILVCLLCLSKPVEAQFEVDFSTSPMVAPNGQVLVDVEVTGFTDIVTMQFSINWDPTVLSFNTIANIYSDPNTLPDYGNGNVGNPDTGAGIDPGEVTTFWLDNTGGTPRTLPSGTRLFTIVLDAIGGPCDETIFEVTDTPRVTEVASEDNGGNVNILNVSFNAANVQITGSGCGGGGGGGGDGCPVMGDTNDLGIVFPEMDVEMGCNICIPVLAQNFQNIESLQFGMSWDASILEYTGIGDFNLFGGAAGRFNTLDTDQGLLRVIWDHTEGGTETFANGDTIFSICYDVIGGINDVTDLLFEVPGFGNEFAAPNSDGSPGSMSVDFYTDCGEAVVIENAGCQDGGGGGGDGPDGCALEGNPNDLGIIFPEQDIEMGTNVCLPVTVANFVNIESFQFGMTWDPTVIDFTGIGAFNLFGGPSGRFNTLNTDQGELRVIWDHSEGGTETFTDGETMFELCFDVVGNIDDFTDFLFELPGFGNEFAAPNSDGSPGSMDVPFYTDCGEVVVIDDNGGGGGGGGGGDGCEPEGDLNGVGIIIAEFDCVQNGETVCVPVTVMDFVNIETMEFRFQWDPTVIEYVGVQNFNLNGNISGVFNELNTDDGKLAMAWADQDFMGGVTRADGETIFEICFDVIGQTGDFSDIARDPERTSEISSNGQAIPFYTDCGQVVVKDPPPPDVLTIAASDETTAFGQTVCVDFLPFNFSGITTMQFAINWDDAILAFIDNADPSNIMNINPSLNVTTSSFNFDDGVIKFQAEYQTPLSLADEDVMFTICFDVISCNNDNPIETLVFAGNGPSLPVEFGDANNNALDPSQFMLTSGTVTVAACTIGPPPMIDLADNLVLDCNDDMASLVPVISPSNATCSWMEIGGNNFTSGNCDITVPAGTYVLTVTDMNGTSATDMIVITEPSAISISDDTQNVLCDQLGSIDLSVSGGTGSQYMYQWEGSTCDTPGACPNSPSITNLVTGLYFVTVTDENNCEETATIDVQEDPNPLQVDANINNVTCTSLGIIALSVSGETGMLTYQWQDDPAATTALRANLNAGDYNYTVTDQATGCDIEGVVQVMDEGTNLTVVEIIVDAGCETEGLGNVMLDVSGANMEDLEFDWADFPMETSNAISNLMPGSYDYSVTDTQTMCVETGTAVVEDEITEFVMSIDTLGDALCHDSSDGFISLEYMGGCRDCGNLTVMWSPEPSGSSLVGNVIMDLPADTYIVTSTDCIGNQVTDVYVIEAPEELMITDVMPTGSEGMDGTISVQVSGGVMPYEYIWSGISCPCPDASFIDQLAPDTYDLMVVDSNGCIVEELDIAVIDSTPIIMIEEIIILSEAEFDGYGVSCFNTCDGMITATISGAEGAVEIQLMGGPMGITQTYDSFPISGLCAGEYTMTVTDDEGKTDQESFMIIAPPPVEVSVVDIECSRLDSLEGRIDIAAIGGVGGLTYQWTNGDTIQDIENLAVGSYSVVVSDENDCLGIIQNIVVPVCVPPMGECYEGSLVITANGDGVNDFLTIMCLDRAENSSVLKVYDRWGREVFEAQEYTNNWQGTDENGNYLNEGAYHWVAEVTFDTGRTEIFKGTVTILRD